LKRREGEDRRGEKKEGEKRGEEPAPTSYHYIVGALENFFQSSLLKSQSNVIVFLFLTSYLQVM
jgi:hypothetical protein